jgi:hypothetical protein
MSRNPNVNLICNASSDSAAANAETCHEYDDLETHYSPRNHAPFRMRPGIASDE